MTTIFGNPGSTELPLFRDFPDDFRYVLGLQESVVVGMADGYAQATRQRRVRQPALGGRRRPRHGQHLHRLPQPHAARHHRRAAGAVDSSLRAVSLRHAGGEAARAVREVEQSSRRAAKTCRARSRAPITWRCRSRAARRSSRFPVDDWDRTDGAASRTRTVSRSTASGPGSDRDDRRAMLDRSARPAFVVGPGVDRNDAWDEVVALAERHQALVWVSPMSSRCSFPERHPLFAGFPAGDARADRQVPRRPRSDRRPRRAGLHVSHRGIRTAHPAGLRAGSDDRRCRRGRVDAGRHGHRVQRAAWRRGAARAIASPPTRSAPQRTQRAPPRGRAPGDRISMAYLMQTLAELRPPDSIIVEESPSSRRTMQAHLPIERPHSFFTCASGGLGHSMPAAVGMALADVARQRQGHRHSSATARRCIRSRRCGRRPT